MIDGRGFEEMRGWGGERKGKGNSLSAEGAEVARRRTVSGERGGRQITAGARRLRPAG